MAAQDDGGRRTEAAPRSTTVMVRASSECETWLCRSTIGAGSDGDDDDRWSEQSAADRADDGDKDASQCQSDEACALEACGGVLSATLDSQKPKDQRRRLTLGAHLDVARAHALRQAMPPLPTPVDVTAKPHDRTHKKKRQDNVHFSIAMAGRRSIRMKMNKTPRKDHADDHLTIYMDYDREPGWGKTPKPARRREVFVVRQAWCIHVVLFLSTASVHCISFNASPALRRLFGIDALPVGLCIVVAWTIVGLIHCVGACLSGFVDRVALLRRLAWLWIVAIVALQFTKLLPLPVWMANTLVALGYSGAIVAHGLLLPNVMALGAGIVTRDAVLETDSAIQSRKRGHAQHCVDAAMHVFTTWAFASTLLSSSLVQAFYFAAVDMELPAGQDVLILRSRRAVLITLPCSATLLSVLTTFLFQSRHHVSPQQLAAQAGTTILKTPTNAVEPQNLLERQLARGEIEPFAQQQAASRTTRLSVRDWLKLGRHSAALLALAFFALLLVLAVVSSLVAHAATSSRFSSLSPMPSTLVHLAVFAVLLVGWVLTMLLSASELSSASRDKLYAVVAASNGHINACESRSLPSREQLFVAVALVCLASAAAFAAFVRAQLYSTMFVQTCQLRRPTTSGVSSVLFDPNVLGAFVGLTSVLLLPGLHCLLWMTMPWIPPPPRLSAARRLTLGVLLYLIAVFFSSVVELYRRDTRLQVLNVHTENAIALYCTKTQPSSFGVLWSVPHLVVLAFADALFRVAAADVAYTLTAPLDWLGVAQALLSLADSVGYAAALTLSKTLSPWLYRVQTSDLVLLLLLVTALASLAFALTRRLADHLDASHHQKQEDRDDDAVGAELDEDAVDRDRALQTTSCATVAAANALVAKTARAADRQDTKRHHVVVDTTQPAAS